ncbi:hypothetical protein DFH28DRAFT_1128395 [Melampsora americana]|nr:hypothetical protein DFH28DRAFT_1128395 [Melampsora americana]
MGFVKSYRSAFVSGFGFVRWLNVLLTDHAIPDWAIAQYIVLYLEESQSQPLPKCQVKSIPFPDWDSEIWITISVSLSDEVEVIVV